MIRFEHYQYNSHKNKIQSIYERSFPQSERFDFDILKKEEVYVPSKYYAPNNIFNCTYAPYYFEAIKMRFEISM